MSASNPVVADVIKIVRLIIKQNNAESISDQTILDYVNRFIQYDLPARLQPLEYKTSYSLELTPNVSAYPAPITNLPSGTNVPTYNSFLSPATIDSYLISMNQSPANNQWWFPNMIYNQYLFNGNGGAVYSFNLNQSPIMQGYIDQNNMLHSCVYITALDINNNLMVLQDSPINLQNGSMMDSDGFSFGSVDYLTGQVDISFPSQVPTSSAVNGQCIPYTPGMPNQLFYYNNTFFFSPVPDKPYLFKICAYMNPSAFLSTTENVPFRYMTEYLGRGAARKILMDFGDVEQLQLYESAFQEQEDYILRRTYRQRQNQPFPSIYNGQNSNNNFFGFGWRGN